MSLKKSVGVKDLPFMDVKLSFEERACDLVSRMSLEEKLTQLAAVTTAEIPHLGVSEYKWWGEALHGISRMPDSDDPKFEKYEQKQTASSFPIDLSMGSTWNKDLVHRLATVIGDEGRAFANEDPSNVMGLTFWSPTINLMRDPRWGRAEENYSEDAFLTSEIAGEFVRGMQGDDEKYLKVASTLKHFAANNSEVNRHSGSSDCDDRTLREFYMRAFKDITEKHHPECVMTSYNRINDIPMSVNTYMLDTILRRTWGFNGHVVTDCGGLGNIINEHQHNWKPNGHEGKYKGKEVAADAMKAGVDINCGYVYRTFTSAAVASGLLPEEVLDKTVVRLFTTRMRTGEFDPAEIMPYSVVNGYSKNAKIRRPHSALLSEKVSDQSVVLIKNEPNSQGDKLLPIDTNKYKNILIMGEQYGKVLLGGYSNAWQQCYEELSVSPLSALKKMGVNYKEIENPSYDYLKDIRNITLTKSNGDKIVLNGTNGENKGCLSKKGDEFVDILPNGLALIAFPGVDMNDTTKFEIEMRGSSKTLVDFMFDDRNQVPTFSVISDDDTNGEYKTYTLDFVKNPPRRALDRVVTLYLRVYDHRTTEERILVLSDEDRQKIKEADIILAFVGHQNGAGDDCDEERDLASFKMPRKQDSLLLQLLELNENVVAYMQGSQVDLRPVEDKLKAITWCCYNGEQQGTTAMNILFGKVNPSGRLPFTWYYDEAELPNIIDYAVRTNDKVAQKTQVTKTEYLGRTYQYFKGKVRYPFGYGLSYTDFEYSDLHIDRKTVSPDDTIKISFNVTNIGDVDGYEVAQVYVKSPNAGTADRPFKQLRGFDKKMIKSGETVRFEIDLPVYKMYFFDNEQHMIFDQGEYIIEVGHDSEKASQNTAKFMLNGELTRRIAHVVASPSAHFIRDVDTVISTNLSVAFNDESFADLEKDVKITFASANENIAVVDEKGNVTGKASGTTKIIATAEYKSAKSKTSFPVTVNFE